MAARFGEPDRPGPIAWKIDDCGLIRGQNPGGGIPIPVLTVDNLNSTNGSVFADLKTVVELEKCLGLRNDTTIVPRGSTNRECPPMRLAPGYAADGIFGMEH